MTKERILIYAPSFYGYENHIAEAFLELGYDVKIFTARINRIIQFFCSFLPPKYGKKLHENRILKYINKYAKNINIFFVIKGEYLTATHIEHLKKINPKVKTIMYQWDSISNHDYSSLIGKIDGIATFDPEDAHIYNITYQPLFFTNDIKIDSSKEDIDLLMIGVFQLERYQYFLKLKELAKSYNLNFQYHIYCPFSHFLKYQILKNKLHIQRLSDIHFFSIGRKKLLKLYKRSKVFVDVCQSDQSGMSMRTIEAYGMNKKLLTGNYDNILKDEFVYDINCLSITAPNNKVIDFINKDTYNYQNRERLSIESWAKNLLKLTDKK